MKDTNTINGLIFKKMKNQMMINDCNPGHNIWALFNNLAQVGIATSKTMLDIQYNKLGTRVASRVAERLKTQDLRKLRNIRKMSNLGGNAA